MREAIINVGKNGQNNQLDKFDKKLNKCRKRLQ